MLIVYLNVWDCNVVFIIVEDVNYNYIFEICLFLVCESVGRLCKFEGWLFMDCVGGFVC